ncbi:hypothetical protein [Streptomyces sp. NPDC015680]|uniref:hypothetical protein n=1 Tax=Streptomyces sp. NPDC015680 TaxID=3364962 RepID=UPI00370342B8
MLREQVLLLVALLMVLAWSAVMAALGRVGAVAALVPSLVLVVQQVAQAGRDGGVRPPAAVPGPAGTPDEEHAG